MQIIPIDRTFSHFETPENNGLTSTTIDKKASDYIGETASVLVLEFFMMAFNYPYVGMHMIKSVSQESPGISGTIIYFTLIVCDLCAIIRGYAIGL